MKTMRIKIFVAAVLALVLSVQARPTVPSTLNYQGRVAVDGANFDGAGLFKFALVNTDASQTYWSNDGSSVAGGEPAGHVSLTVVKGLYSVLLGDESIMTRIDPALFAGNPDARLRIWFNDGNTGYQLLSPDQRLASVGYAMTSATVPDRSIGTDQLANGAVTAAKIGAGQVGSAQLASSLAISGTLQASAFSGSFTGSGAGLTGVPGTFQWQETTTNLITGIPNHGYAVTATTQATIYLPLTSLSVGDTLRVLGVGTGGWRIVPSGGQQIQTATLGYVPAMTWTANEVDREWASIASSADGTKLAAGVIYGQIYTSTDSGLTWTGRESSRQWVIIASSSDGMKLAAVAYGEQIYTSTDSGVNWTPRESNRNWRGIASSADGTKLAAVVDGGLIYTSTDSGVNWTPRESSRYWVSIASSADGTKLAAAVDGGRIYTSINSGGSWTARESNNTWWSIASSADGTKLAAVADGGLIYTSVDTGVNWTPRESNRDWKSITSSADGTKLAATVFHGQIYTSTDSGATWTARESNREWFSIASSADGTKLAATARYGQIYTSTTTVLNTISGGPGTALELQYIGNNTWMPLSFTGPFTFN